MEEALCIVFSEWRQQAAGPMTFSAMMARPTEANTRTAIFHPGKAEAHPMDAVRGPEYTMFGRAMIFKRAVERGELTPAVWEATDARES